MKELANDWVERAEEDYRVSKIVLRTDDFASSGAFHAHQCAEKYLKAFLVNADVPPPKTHNLRELNSMCAEVDPEFWEIDESLHFLNPFSTASRYPGMRINIQDAREAVKHAEKVRDFVKRKLGLEGV